jgi:predicted acylesterase/phospholipase RssA
MRRVVALMPLLLGLALGACATVHNLPLNEPSASPISSAAMQAVISAAAKQKPDTGEGVAIGLAFSGGGTRAAAFAYGVLSELDDTPYPRRGKAHDMLEHVAVVSGVSGGSVTAAYYALKGRAAIADFRQRFLVQDVMAELNTNVSLVSLNRALGGGANTDERLRNWLDANLFDHATFATVLARGETRLLINATDVYSRTPFVFSPQTFGAICSDYSGYPLAEAVAASAAVPAAFAPVVLKTYPGECNTPLPDWITRQANDPSGSPLLHAYAKSMVLARTGKVKYIKLFDGGMVDNYGLSGVTIIRTASQTPYGPLSPQDAVNLRRLMFLVVDAGRGPQGDWNQTVEGPAGKELVGAVFDAIIDANSRSSYAAFEATMKNWRSEIVRWRCGLKRAEVARLRGHGGPWNCRDLQIVVGRVGFDQLEPARAERLNKVATSFTLPTETVDEVSKAGRDALRTNKTFQAFLKSL